MLELVKNEPKYYEYIRSLRNNPELMTGFIQKTIITEEQQIEYMKKYSDCYHICLFDGNPCGYIGVIEKDIRVATDLSYQKKGIGLFMVNKIKEIYNNNVEAKIMADNIASVNLFLKAGFETSFFLMTPKNNK
jgi:hypothetical protein